MALGPNQTTLPSHETAHATTGNQVLCIRWLFPDPHGRVTRLAQSRITFGRSSECDVRLDGTETSRQHAEIRREGMLHILSDLKSRNGVQVNGKTVTEAPLAPGQVVRMGEWVGVLFLGVDPAEVDQVSQEGSVFSLIAPGLAGGPILRPVLEQLQRAAQSDLPIVLLGETGTGKEGCSRAIHRWSGRRGALVAVNCAALPSALAEAELFGYRKGAFTGADRSHPGYFRSAHQGTLLLDELTDLPLELQGKLLRVIEQREVHPIGEASPVPVDVRIVAATQISLSQAVAERRFRPDLCARLEGLTASLPPLRTRKQEIPYVFRYLLAEHAGGHPPAVEPRLIEQLCLYDWPYNVRELDLLARRLLVLHTHEGLLKRSHLPDHMLRSSADEAAAHARPVAASASSNGARSNELPKAAAPFTVEAYRERRERELTGLLAALREHGGNVARAPSAIGISRQRAYRLMEAPNGADEASNAEADRS